MTSSPRGGEPDLVGDYGEKKRLAIPKNAYQEKRGDLAGQNLVEQGYRGIELVGKMALLLSILHKDAKGKDFPSKCV